MSQFDVAIVGGGILGLAHAWTAVRRGLRVLLLERSAVAQGASIRNFGMVWPVGQPDGERLETALRSREQWLEASRACGFWLAPCGSIHLAHRADELAVLEEMAQQRPGLRMLTPAEVVERSPGANPLGLLGGLWSPTEAAVDPREAPRKIAAWLASQPGVEVRFGCAVRDVRSGSLTTAQGETFHAERIFVCAGADLVTLFPEALSAAGLRLCKLQMLRTAPQPPNWRLGPHLASGLTIRHYDNFAACPSLAALRERIARETPELDRYGIHVMAAHNGLGEVVLGDSHEYGDAITPFDKQEIEGLMLRELRRVIRLPHWEIAARWNGVYAKTSSAAALVSAAAPGVQIVTGTGGAGMTLSFGLAERNLAG
ncbi:MAG: TIGR03364 family FAD-dependent oxidoreductase [Acidobacteria bacterium]|nr:TIGR03364 family FAD-dependent oxidoreductase [Acidobacteriota bacterium]